MSQPTEPPKGIIEKAAFAALPSVFSRLQSNKKIAESVKVIFLIVFIVTLFVPPSKIEVATGGWLVIATSWWMRGLYLLLAAAGFAGENHYSNHLELERRNGLTAKACKNAPDDCTDFDPVVHPGADSIDEAAPAGGG